MRVHRPSALSGAYPERQLSAWKTSLRRSSPAYGGTFTHKNMPMLGVALSKARQFFGGLLTAKEGTRAKVLVPPGDCYWYQASLPTERH